ncbi:ribonuclease domain-containing protein [Pseudomonas putida]|uniref:ribonuclease domain-containing protein n=1 Tax=Pseudomonas putida TaxID=303 RepID=UPI0009BFA1CD
MNALKAAKIYLRNSGISKVSSLQATIRNCWRARCEWRVRTPGGSGAGARRIVVDKKTGQAYYTHDHYDSYIEIDMGGWK